MSKIQFAAESNYLAARDIAASLFEKNLLTEEEFRQIDQLLQEKFSAVLGPLLAENPCYVTQSELQYA